MIAMVSDTRAYAYFDRVVLVILNPSKNPVRGSGLEVALTLP